MIWRLQVYLARRWPPLGKGRNGRGHNNRYHLEVTWIYTIRNDRNLIRCLVALPGGVRFRSFEIVSPQPGDDLTKLLVACSPTLEALTTHCFETSESGT